MGLAWTPTGRHRHPQPDLVPGATPRTSPRASSRPAARRLLPAALLYRHRRHRRPRLAWGGDELWMVNTRFSCSCTAARRYSFVPRWRRRSFTALAAEDRCSSERWRSLTAGPSSSRPGRERHRRGLAGPDKPRGGCLLDVSSGGRHRRLSMPTRRACTTAGSGCWNPDRQLVLVDAATAGGQTVAALPASPRLACAGRMRYRPVQDSQKTSAMDGVPCPSGESS